MFEVFAPKLEMHVGRHYKATTKKFGHVLSHFLEAIFVYTKEFTKNTKEKMP